MNIIKTVQAGVFTLNLSSNNSMGKANIIDWGNGNTTTITLNSSLQKFSITYLDSSEKCISITNEDIISILDCNSMNITDLNLSSLSNLEKLICYNNSLSTLDFSSNSIIQYIHCFNNPLILNDSNLISMINSLPNRNNTAYGSIIIDNKPQMLKVESISIQKDWLFGSAIMYNPTEWAKCGYHFKAMGIADIWESAEMGDGISIAIIDHGFDLNCQEYDLSLIKDIHNFSNQGTSTTVTQPTSGQTTHSNSTSNLIMAKGVKMYGIAPKAQFILLKASDATSICYTSWVSNAIDYARQKGADLISTSLSFPAANITLETAVKNYCLANKKIDPIGHPLICSSGNTGDSNANTNDFRYPGAYKYPITVGAINSSNSMANWSSSYIGIDVVSYGVNITSQVNYNSYGTVSGTSFSTPIVAGIVALLIKIFIKRNSRKPTEKEVYQELIKRTIPMNIDSRLCGVGRIMLTAYNGNPTQIQHT